MFEIYPDMDQALSDFEELRVLSVRYGFDLFGALQRLSEDFSPVWTCDVDWEAAAAAGYAVARYRLADELQSVLAALRVGE